MPGKIGIRIPSHNSLTTSFLDELLRMVATSRKKPVDAHRIRRRLPEKHHIAIVSTGLSYLSYLGALKKVPDGYKPSRLGKKIGRFLAQDHTDEANVVWRELLIRHRLFGVFKKFFSTRGNKHRTIEDFGLYLRKRAHSKWKIPAIRSRISRLCELFAEKGLIEYQNGHLSPIDQEEKELAILDAPPQTSKPQTTLPNSTSRGLLDGLTTKSSQAAKASSLITANSWPVRIEIKLEISDKASKEVIAMIFSHIKDMQRTVRTPLATRDSKETDTQNALAIQESQKKQEG